MAFLGTLWVPILVSAVVCFIMSALNWMVLPLHKTEWVGMKGEDAVLDALRASGATPGRYMAPFMDSGKLLETPEGRAKMERGPLAMITLGPGGMRPMGPMLVQSFLGGVVVSIFVAYLAYHTVAPGAEYMQVFRITGTATFMAYGLGYIPESVWFMRPWKSLWIQLFDSLVYGLLTGGVFGWLWP